MSVDTLTLLDDVDWIATKGIYPEIDHTVISIIRYVAWRQGDKPPFAMYISQVDLLKHTGFGKSNFYENLEIAIKYEFLTRLTRGSNTNSTRAHYRINENRISLCPKIEKKVRYSGQGEQRESAIGDRTVRSKGVPSPVGETRLSGIDDPKRHERQKTTLTTSNVIKNINYERFNKLLECLPKEFRSYIKPGRNYEKKLDELERKGTPFKAIGEYLAKQNWYGAESKGGLLTHFLDVLLGIKKVGESSSMPKWCGGDYCDEVTRLWPEASIGKDGKLTYECDKCHPSQLVKNGSKLSPSPETSKVLTELRTKWDVENLFKIPE